LSKAKFSSIALATVANFNADKRKKKALKIRKANSAEYMFYKYKKNIVALLSSIQSKRLNKKIIVFESDDWGSIRTPSRKAFFTVQQKNNITDDPYTLFDTLECTSDINKFVEILVKFKDFQGQYPLITTNFVMANPDFEAISESEFENYSYKILDKSYKDYYPNEEVLSTIQIAINNKFFFPQFHGREHVNVQLWLTLLKNGHPIFMEAFKKGFWGVRTSDLKKWNKSIQASFDLKKDEQKLYINDALEEGLNIFENIFGFRSQSFIPNNYIWPTDYNQKLKELGVDYLQGTRIQLSPQLQYGEKRNWVNRKPGFEENGGLISIVRNGSFEPSFYPGNRKKALDMCLADIEAAFRFKQPAVISIHRVNFVSGLDVRNRDENLKLFKELLQKILKRWPDVQFLNSVELGDMYKSMNDSRSE